MADQNALAGQPALPRADSMQDDAEAEMHDEHEHINASRLRPRNVLGIVRAAAQAPVAATSAPAVAHEAAQTDSEQIGAANDAMAAEQDGIVSEPSSEAPPGEKHLLTHPTMLLCPVQTVRASSRSNETFEAALNAGSQRWHLCMITRMGHMAGGRRQKPAEPFC